MTSSSRCNAASCCIERSNRSSEKLRRRSSMWSAPVHEREVDLEPHRLVALVAVGAPTIRELVDDGEATTGHRIDGVLLAHGDPGILVGHLDPYPVGVDHHADRER